MAHDVTKLYDQKEFRERLYKDSRPQTKQKRYEQSLKAEANPPTDIDQAFLPGGIPVPVSTGIPENIAGRPIGEFVEEMPGVFYNEKAGIVNVTLPEFLDDGSYDPSIYDKINGLSIPEAKAKRDAERRKNFLDEVNRM